MATSATFTFRSITTAIIEVQTGSGTLDQLYTDAVAHTAGCMTKTGQVYAIVGNRELELESGVTLNMVEDDELDWDRTNGTAFDVQSGATFTAAPGCVLNFDTSNGNYCRWDIQGYTSLQGTETKPILIKRYYETRIFSNEGNTPHNWTWIEFQDPSSYSTGNSALQFNNDSDTKLAHSFTNIKLNNRTNSGYICSFYPADWSDCVFDNWETTDTAYGFNSYGANFKFTNSTFRQIYYYNLLRGTFAGSNYMNVFDSNNLQTQAQPKITFENCVFEDNYNASSSERGFYSSTSFVIKLKDCTFQGVEDAMYYGAMSYYNSKLLYEGTTTFTNVTINRYWASNGQHLHTRSLDLTVNGSDGNPLANASVIIRQKEGKEFWHFQTDANGQIKDCFGDNPVFVEKEETSTGSYTQWSDGTGDQVHEITISHPDYNCIDTREVAFTENRTIVAQLSENATGVTTIYDSTIYDSTIY